MSGCAFPPLNVGFRKGQSISPLRLFIYSVLAFLTAKTLPIGLADDETLEGVLGDIVRPISGQEGDVLLDWSPKGFKVYLDKDRRIIKRDDVGFRVFHGGLFSCRSQLTLRPAKKIRLLHPEYNGDLDKAHADPRNYEFMGDQRASTEQVLYRPCCMLQVFNVRGLSRSSNEDDIAFRRFGGWLIFIDVLVGMVMRCLQSPYFVMMYLWHNSGSPCFYASVDKHGRTQCAVFRLRDQVFTCFAVVMNSVVVVAMMGLARFSLEAPSEWHMQVFVVCSAFVAVSTAGGVFMTVAYMASQNAKLAREARALSDLIWRGKSPEDVIRAAKEAVRSKADTKPKREQGGIVRPEHELFRQELCCGEWEATCRGIAAMMYLGAVTRGAYLPAHFASGYGGVNALSFVEELCHFVPHFLSSVMICAAEPRGQDAMRAHR